MFPPSCCHRQRGFTIIEILAVMAVVIVLAALSVPVVQRAIAKSHRATAMSNMRQIYGGLLGYHGDHHRFPQLIETTEEGDWGSIAWHHEIAPYLDYKPEDIRGGRKPPKVLRDPAAKNTTWRGAYGVVYQEQRGPIRRVAPSESLMTLRQPATTPLLGTAQQWVDGEPWGSWYVPNVAPAPGQNLELSDRHEGGAVLVFADGHAEWMLRETAYERYFPWRND